MAILKGKTLHSSFAPAEGKLDRLPELAAELVRLKVDVIVALYVPSALAAKQATREIPIVIIAADPVETGIVPSLARPGGNITGVSLMSAVFVGKCVELFRDMLPAMRRVAVLTNAADALFAKLVLDHVEVAGRLSGIKMQPITLRGPDQELDAAFAAMTKEQADAVVIQGSLSTKRLADLAREHRLPAASSTRAFVDAGGLMSYGADGPALFRLGAMFVHRVLQGRAAERPTNRATHEIRVGHQPEDCEGNGPRDSRDVLGSSRHTARMIWRYLLRCMSPVAAHRVRCQCPDFASAFGALRKSANDRQEPATTRLTQLRHRPPNFAVMHNAAFPTSGVVGCNAMVENST